MITDSNPFVTVANQTISESGGTATFTITLSESISEDVSVVYSTGTGASNGATDGTDYTGRPGQRPSHQAVQRRRLKYQLLRIQIQNLPKQRP